MWVLYLCPDPAPQSSSHQGDLGDKSFLAICVCKPKTVQNAPGCMIPSLVLAAGADGTPQGTRGSLGTSDSVGALKQPTCINWK